jgi:hypothetical protein
MTQVTTDAFKLLSRTVPEKQTAAGCVGRTASTAVGEHRRAWARIGSHISNPYYSQKLGMWRKTWTRARWGGKQTKAQNCHPALVVDVLAGDIADIHRRQTSKVPNFIHGLHWMMAEVVVLQNQNPVLHGRHSTTLRVEEWAPKSREYPGIKLKHANKLSVVHAPHDKVFADVGV